MVRFNRGQRVTIGALIGMGLLNPMSVEVLNQYFKMAYTGLFVACSVWVAVYLLKKVLTPEPVITEPKGKKKATKYIET